MYLPMMFESRTMYLLLESTSVKSEGSATVAAHSAAHIVLFIIESPRQLRNLVEKFSVTLVK